MSGIERRPAGDATVAAFPREWIERYGRPPLETRMREEWIRHAILKEPPAKPPDRRADLLAEVDELLAEDRTEYRSALAIPSGVGGHVAQAGSSIRGLLVPFGRDSYDLGGFVERFAPDAFAEEFRSTRFGHVVSLWHHVSDALLGSVSSGSLGLKIEPRGISFVVDPPHSGIGGYVRELVGRGDARGASLAFRAVRDRWSVSDGKNVRTVLEARLREATVTYSPAYPDALVELRNVERGGSRRVAELERELRARRYRSAKRERLHATRPGS